MFVARRCAWEKGFASLHIVGEAAGGQHHAFRRTDFDFAFYRRHHRTADNAILHDQTPGGRGFDQLNPQLVCRLREARNQRHAVDQLHRAPVNREVQQVAGEPLADVEQRT